jgi:hypothetical protein
MADARRTDKPRQIRFQITAGVGDLQDMEELLRDELEGDWDLTFRDLKAFGDHGPMHKLSLGFIQSIT